MNKLGKELYDVFKDREPNQNEILTQAVQQHIFNHHHEQISAAIPYENIEWQVFRREAVLHDMVIACINMMKTDVIKVERERIEHRFRLIKTETTYFFIPVSVWDNIKDGVSNWRATQWLGFHHWLRRRIYYRRYIQEYKEIYRGIVDKVTEWSKVCPHIPMGHLDREKVRHFTYLTTGFSEQRAKGADNGKESG